MDALSRTAAKGLLGIAALLASALLRAQESGPQIERVGTEETTAAEEPLGAAPSTVPVIESGPLDASGATRLRVTGISGLALRFFWFETADQRKPAAVEQFVYPVGAPYPSQVIRRTAPIYLPGACVRTDEQGNAFLSYEAPIALRPDRPLLLGFAADATFLRDSYVVLDSARADGSTQIPSRIAEVYLPDAPEYDLRNEAIQQAAQSLKEGDPAPAQLLGRLWRFVNSHFRYKSGPRPNTAPQLLKRGYGTCSEFTRLTVALARACGLPAREICALRMNPGGGPVEHNHNWAEVWLPGAGWIPAQTQLKPPADGLFRCDSLYYLVLNRGTGLTMGLPYKTDKRVIAAQNTTPRAAGSRGYGWFVEAPAAERARGIDLLQAIAADDGSKAAALLDQVAKASTRLRPVLNWALAASADAAVGEQAAERLVRICEEKNRNEKIELFLEASPSLVRRRINQALGMPRIPREAKSFGGNAYFLFDQRLTWFAAQKHCEALGGHLLAIGGPEEQDFAAGLLAAALPKARCWIGLRRADPDKAWQWVAGQGAAYANWGEGLPDNAGGHEEFADMGAAGAAWNDRAGTDFCVFLCEWEGR